MRVKDGKGAYSIILGENDELVIVFCPTCILANFENEEIPDADCTGMQCPVHQELDCRAEMDKLEKLLNTRN